MTVSGWVREKEKHDLIWKANALAYFTVYHEEATDTYLFLFTYVITVVDSALKNLHSTSRAKYISGVYVNNSCKDTGL